MNSSDGTASFVEFGLDRDIPQAGDYDGDGTGRPGSYSVRRTEPGTGSEAQMISRQGLQFGQNGDQPVVGDYDETA
jgi:hypothetical protein